MSRTRLIRPGFFSDERMARLPAWTRLVYVGLWTLCDDAGYFERKPAELAADLFRYDRPAVRLRRVEQALEQLVEHGRVTWLECGEHGTIPTLPEHGVPRGGNHAYNVKAKHDEQCALTLFKRRQAAQTKKYVPGTDKSVSVLGSDSVLESSRAPARDTDETTGAKARLAAYGYSPSKVPA